MKIVVLGAGLVGGPIARDLAKDPGHEVWAVDASAGALARLEGTSRVHPVREDLSVPGAIEKVVSHADFAVSAVPGFMGFETLRAIIESGTNVVDIAFFPEDPFSLDALARERGVTALVDCGVAPGMSNVLAGRASVLFEEMRSLTIYVGGLPEVREWPFEYRAVFSPADVIEEYLRPARLVERGEVVVRPALSERELIDFPLVGTLEAFNTDGLRTLATTIRAREMREKTLRYPGHVEKIALLRDTGFFGTESLEAGGVRVRPLDVTSALLFPKWKLREGDRDVTVFRLVAEGTRGGRRHRRTYDMLDRYDEATRVHSMARTTGYTATTAARMIMRGMYREAGVSAPEAIGRREECVEFMLAGLRERGIVYRETVEGPLD